MAQTRQEKDSLGVVEVPGGAMYGAQTARAVENFPISGMRASKFLIRAIAMVKQAAAEANSELGAISEERARAIAAAAAEVVAGKWDGEFVVDVFQAGAGVSFHMNANEVIANRANQIIASEQGKADSSAVLRNDKTKEKYGGPSTEAGARDEAEAKADSSPFGSQSSLRVRNDNALMEEA